MMESPSPRCLRYSRAGRPAGDVSCASYQAAAVSRAETRVAWRSALWRSSGEATGRGRPASRASRSTASGKLKASLRMRKPITSPWAPQPKQWKNPFSSLTVKEGVFSLWNGQSPRLSRPRRCSLTLRAMMPTSERRCRSSSRHWGGKLNHPARKTLLQPRHDPAHVLDGPGVGLGDRRLDGGAGLRLVELPGQEARDDRDLLLLLAHQIGAVALLVEDDALLALLHHLLQHLDDLRLADPGGIARRPSGDVPVLELRQDHAQRGHRALVAGLQRFLQRIVQSLAQHGVPPWLRMPESRKGSR